MRRIKIEQCPYNEGEQIFEKNSVTFKPGVTVLVGCNGAGKTTMVRDIKYQLERNDVELMSFNNLTDGGNNAMQMALNSNRLAMLATQAMSSEGENIVINIGYNAGLIGEKLRKHSDLKELWIFFDAVDSGLSIDNIVDIKKYLFDVIMYDPGNADREIYIIVTANSYEMTIGYNCLDVQSCNYITFDSYEEYRDFILNSNQKKENR